MAELVTITLDVWSAFIIIVGASLIGIGSELGKELFHNYIKPNARRIIKRR